MRPRFASGAASTTETPRGEPEVDVPSGRAYHPERHRIEWVPRMIAQVNKQSVRYV
jgi:hypothetical protein